jgi:hypothetical protein
MPTAAGGSVRVRERDYVEKRCESRRNKTHNRHPFPGRDSNLLSQQASGHRITRKNERPLGSDIKDVAGHKIQHSPD